MEIHIQRFAEYTNYVRKLTT